MKWHRTALAFGIVYPTVMACIYFLLMAGGGDGGEPNPAQQLGYSLSKAFQFLFPVLYLWLVTKAFPWPGRPTTKGLVPGVGFGLFIAAIGLGAYYWLMRGSPFLATTPELIRSKLQEFGITTIGAYVVFTLLISLIHSLLEEYYWRWFIFGGLRKHLSFTNAMLLSSLGFMAHHVVVLYVYLPGYFWTAAVPFSLAIAIGGAFWAWLYEKTGNIYAVWLSHALIDGAIFVIGYDLIQA